MILHPPVDLGTYMGMLSEFDVGLITLARTLRTYNLPSKMLGYMYFAMPILASISPGNDLRDLLEAQEAGLVCLNGEDERLRDLAVRLVRDPALRRRLGRNARRLLESTFTAEAAARQILSQTGAGP
jgi:glycosyltransferase involved in cell wall biosynthesis